MVREALRLFSVAKSQHPHGLVLTSAGEGLARRAEADGGDGEIMREVLQREALQFFPRGQIPHRHGLSYFRWRGSCRSG